MYQRLVTQVRKQLNSLVDQYDSRLHTVPGYANLPESARRELEQHVLQIMIECLEADDASRLIEYIHQRAEQVLVHGFQPEWFLQAVIIPQDIITPLTKSVEESNFVWRTLGQAQATVWEIVAHERRRLEQEAKESLARRDIQVRTSTEVAQEIAAATDLDELFQRVVTSIKERFNYYYAQLFRYEPAQDAVVLITGYGEIGQQMLAAGHKLTMGRGVVGTAAATGQSILAADVAADEDWRPNPFLPETKGELAVPIKLRQEVLGILDVQSDQIGALTDDDRLLLEGLCGQIATAMANKQAEQAIKEEQQRTQTILATVTVPVLISRLSDSKVLYANQALADFRHMVLDEFIGSHTTDYFVVPEDRERLVAILRQQGYATDFETQLRGSGGKVSWVLLSARIIKFQGETCVLSSYIDITERKQVEEAIKEEQRRTQTILEAVTVPVVISRVSDGQVLYANQALAEFSQVRLEDIVGRHARDFFADPHDRDKMGELLQRQSSVSNFEVQVQGGAGQVGWVMLSARIINYQNEPCVLSSYVDITERKRAEAESARSAQLLNTIINVSPDLIYIKDLDSRFLMASQAVARLLGAPSAADLIGKNDYDFFPYELAHKYYTDEQRIIQEGKPLLGIEEPSVYPDGTQIWLLTTKVPYRAADGTLLGIVGIGRDITERKRSEQKMEETLHETERLYAAVSHESWQTYRRTSSLGEGYVFDQALIQPAENVWEPEIAQALEQRTLVTSRSGQRAVAVTPLAVRGEAIGALGVYDDPAHPLSKDDLDLIETVSEQVALALESARLFDQTQMALADTRALFRFSDLVSRETGIKSVYDNVAQLLVEETGFAGAWIAQVDTQAQVLRGVAGAGLGMGPDRNYDIVPYPQTQTPATIAARDRVMIVVNDPLRDERMSGLPEQMKIVVGKSIAVPIIIDGEIESIIAATRPIDGLDIGERDQRLLQTAAAQVAIAIQRARLFERTQRDAEREHTINRVTSRIRNARSVDEVLTIAAQELRLATRASRSVVEILPTVDQAPHSGNGEGGKA